MKEEDLYKQCVRCAEGIIPTNSRSLYCKSCDAFREAVGLNDQKVAPKKVLPWYRPTPFQHQPTEPLEQPSDFTLLSTLLPKISVKDAIDIQKRCEAKYPLAKGATGT